VEQQEMLKIELKTHIYNTAEQVIQEESSDARQSRSRGPTTIRTMVPEGAGRTGA
jgi:hypothetical protein